MSEPGEDATDNGAADRPPGDMLGVGMLYSAIHGHSRIPGGNRSSGILEFDGDNERFRSETARKLSTGNEKLLLLSVEL